MQSVDAHLWSSICYTIGEGSEDGRPWGLWEYGAHVFVCPAIARESAIYDCRSYKAVRPIFKMLSFSAASSPGDCARAVFQFMVKGAFDAGGLGV